MGKDVETTISYWRAPEDGSLPDAEHFKELLLGHRDEEKQRIIVRDIRGTESTYFLDTHGFEVHKLSAKGRDILDQEVVKTKYYEEISNLVKEMSVLLYFLPA